jgi:hypothetical protein
MVSTPGDCLIQPTTSLQDFFKSSIENAVEKLNIEGNDETLWYLTQLLCSYSKTSKFLDDNGTRAALTPLAEYYRLAVESPTKHERWLQLQRLGDVAIIVAGLFAGALKRKPVNVNYYMSMGEAAYATLADETARSARERSLQLIFSTLSNDFSDYVVALSEIPTRTNHRSNLLQMVDDWEKTQHPALAIELRKQGIFIDHLNNERQQMTH